jgi:hypothetical protein
LLIATLCAVLLKFIAVNVIMLIVVILVVVTMPVVLLLLLQEGGKERQQQEGFKLSIITNISLTRNMLKIPDLVLAT